MARNARSFTDLDLNFGLHPVTHDVISLYDEQAIKLVTSVSVTTSYLNVLASQDRLSIAQEDRKSTRLNSSHT